MEKNDMYDFPLHYNTQKQNTSPYLSLIVWQCKWPSLSKKNVEIQKFWYHGNLMLTTLLLIISIEKTFALHKSAQKKHFFLEFVLKESSWWALFNHLKIATLEKWWFFTLGDTLSTLLLIILFELKTQFYLSSSGNWWWGFAIDVQKWCTDWHVNQTRTCTKDLCPRSPSSKSKWHHTFITK